MNMPVSVVMAVFNGREFLQEQVDSVLAQLEHGDELLVIDDASTDGGLASLRALARSQVRILVNAQNVGVIRSFQRGLALTSHNVVFLCDQDDVWMPGKRAAYVAEFVRDNAIGVVISDSEVIDCEGRMIAPSFMASRGGFNGSVIGTLWRNRYLGCAMAIRRNVLENALPFPAKVPMHDMWLGAIGAISGRVSYLPQPYMRYRRHRNNLTPSHSQKPWHQLVRWRVAMAWLVALRMLRVRLGVHRTGMMKRASANPTDQGSPD
jgi:glycosyltransferase involved in cell wall biosynthesis